MLFHVAFMLVLILSQGNERSVVLVSGFDKLHCLDSRDWVKSKGYYRDEDGTYRLDSAQCIREYVNRT